MAAASAARGNEFEEGRRATQLVVGVVVVDEEPFEVLRVEPLIEVIAPMRRTGRPLAPTCPLSQHKVICGLHDPFVQVVHAHGEVIGEHRSRGTEGAAVGHQYGSPSSSRSSAVVVEVRCADVLEFLGGAAGDGVPIGFRRRFRFGVLDGTR